VAGVAVWEHNRSRVAVPHIDRLYLEGHEGRERLLRAAAALARGGGSSTEGEWKSLLADLVPPKTAATENIPFAIEGLSS
jgi:hypothetical protein